MAKKAAAPDPNERLGARKEIELPAVTPEQARRDIARLMTSPEFAAARAMQATEGIQGYGAQLDTAELLKYLRVQAEITSDGDLAQVEKMLLCQATALQSLFARLVERGMHADLLLRIPRKLDGRSMANWTPVPRQSGQSERSDAGGESVYSWMDSSVNVG